MGKKNLEFYLNYVNNYSLYKHQKRFEILEIMFVLDKTFEKEIE